MRAFDFTVCTNTCSSDGRCAAWLVCAQIYIAANTVLDVNTSNHLSIQPLLHARANRGIRKQAKESADTAG